LLLGAGLDIAGTEKATQAQLRDIQGKNKFSLRFKPPQRKLYTKQRTLVKLFHGRQFLQRYS